MLRAAAKQQMGGFAEPTRRVGITPPPPEKYGTRDARREWPSAPGRYPVK